MSPTPSIFWFRRDLRLADNPALTEAAGLGPVLAVFVIDDHLWRPAGINRIEFVRSSLTALDASIDGSLAVVDGPPARALTRLAATVGAERVYATEDFGPYGRRRDSAVAKALETVGIELRLVDSPYAVKPGSLVTGGGTSYKVFTPFFRSWKGHGWDRPLPVPSIDWLAPPELPGLPERAAARATEAPAAIAAPPAGEHAAWDAAERFLAEPVCEYGATRDLPAIDGTSRLSPYLKWGALHPRQLLDRLGPSPGEEVFRSEICWREFYAEVLYSRPDSARQAYVPKMAGMEVDAGPAVDPLFRAWTEGRTGYPLVDAGMRQLVAEGWMHNRVRMIAASFLVKDLHVDWTRGARFFMNHLVDGDLASNSHGWQWVAGTGTDASPYFRIFNPVGQSKKFDPDGGYLRRWIPEIAHLPNRSIHAPWTEKTGAPAGYPPPIVDHDLERRESLDRYDRLKQDWA
ncbi:MAG: cryptochrome/photolyase family protein [Acidimicrobiales bacterium]